VESCLSNTKHRYLWPGVAIACGTALCLAIVFLVSAGMSYDGKCGGFFPELSMRRPCSFWGYLSGDVLAIALIVGVAYWPLALILMILAVAVVYFLNRRRNQ
jgi:hypothetical protein